MRLTDIDESRSQLKPFLRQLLGNRGVEIDARGFFKCPAHDDTNASAHFIPGTDDTKWMCHGCSAVGDIFDAAKYLDGLSVNGPSWIKETLPKLADEFNVELRTSGQELTVAEQQIVDVYRAYELASRLVVESKRSPEVDAKLEAYGWSKRTLRVFGIGTVSSYDRFLKALLKQGIWSREFLTEVGLADPRIFRPECLIFTIKDPNGRPIAFSSRFLDFEEQEAQLEALRAGEDQAAYRDACKKAQPKYVNSSSRSQIFKKKELLFGLHAARNTSRTLWVFEGNADAVTASDRGLINCAAVCGSTFSETHFTIALDAGFNHLVFVMDGDKAGQDATRRVTTLAETFLADKPEVRVDIVDLPADNGKVDPDLLIRTQGLRAFCALPRHSRYYWSWRECLNNADNITVASDAARQIVQQENPLLRYDMLANLHELTRIPLELLWETVVRKAESESTQAAASIRASADWMRFMRDQADIARKAIETATQQEVHEIEANSHPLVATRLLPLIPVAETAVAELTPAEKTANGAALWKV